MCSNSQAALDQFIKDNEGNNEPCIISVRTALNDHNENCKQLNSDNKNTIIAIFLMNEWENLLNDYQRVLGGKDPDDTKPYGIDDENLRGYLGGPEWGGLNNDKPILSGGGFAICTQPVKYDRGVNHQNGQLKELCSAAHWDSYGHKCDAWKNYESDHTSHWNCRHSMGLACTGNSQLDTAAAIAGYTNLGTQMCYLQGSTGGGQPPAIGHSAGYTAFIKDRCGKDGCSPALTKGGVNKKCKDIKPSNYYWGSLLSECGYNGVGIQRRIKEFPTTRLARGKYLDRITKNATPAYLGVDDIKLDDILDYYISKLNSAYPDIKLTKDNIREHTGPIKNSAGFPEEGKKDDYWDADPKKLQAIKDDAAKKRGPDKLALPNCCSNSIEMGDGSHAILKDINQSCSFNSTTQTETQPQPQPQTQPQPQPQTQPQTEPDPQSEKDPEKNPDPNEGFFSSIPDWVYIVGLVIIALITLLIVF